MLAEGAAIGHWSPDGRKLAFFRDSELFVVDADGSGERSLGDPETVPLSRP